MTPPVAVLLWLLATGAGLPPLCAFADGLMAHRLRADDRSPPGSDRTQRR